MNWDRLAGVWAHFEDTGLRGEDLGPIASALAGPVLLVGAGQGLVGEALGRWASPLVAVDRSLAMNLAARCRRGLAQIAADGEALPLARGSCGSAVVSTGVLSPATLDLARAVLREVTMCVFPRGSIVVSGFVVDEGHSQPARDLGLLEGRVQRNDRMLEVWRRFALPIELSARVASWTGVSRTEASARLRTHAQYLKPLVGRIDRVARDLAHSGLDPWETLRASFAIPQTLFEPGELAALLSSVGLRLEVELTPREGLTVLQARFEGST